MVSPIKYKLARNNFKKRIIFLLFLTIFIVVTNYFGIFHHLFERDFYDDFDYSLNVDIVPLINQLKNDEIPSIPPINSYDYKFLKKCIEKCKGLSSLGLVIVVKSAIHHSEIRQVIRSTYGNEKRLPNLLMKTVFLLGVKKEDNEAQKYIDLESDTFGDIIQADFIDSYFNNTIKTMMGLKWTIKYCPNAKYYYFTDDDMYVSVKNLLKFIANPSHYPFNDKNTYSIKNEEEFAVTKHKLISSNDIKPYFSTNIVEDFKTTNKNNDAKGYEDVSKKEILFAGFVHNNSPYRNKNSKWYVPLGEYPWHKWPPFIPAGAYILSNEALTMLYYGSFYTKHFRFDDIYLAIIAKKCGIIPFHCNKFYMQGESYDAYEFRNVIAAHGYFDSMELLKTWNEQNSLGNA